MMPSHWELSRRTLIGAGVAAALTPAPAFASKRRRELMFIGMHGPEIHAAWFDSRDGAMTAIGPVAQNPRPTWAVRHPRRSVLYFVEESGSDAIPFGGVQAFNVDVATGELNKMSDERTGGGGATHIWLDQRSNTLLAANYAGGSIAVMPVARNGALGPSLSVLAMSGQGPHRRQASPHVHQTRVDPSGRFVLAADLGADRVWVIPFNRCTRALGPYDPMSPRHYASPAGSGPRHIAFHPDGRVLYLVNEMSAEVHVLAWDRREGSLERLQAISINAAEFSGASSGGEIAVSRDGRFVYVSNRGDHTLVTFSIDRRSKQLSVVQRVPSGGERPWHFALHRSGDWLVCANRDANALRLFRVDRRSGALGDTGTGLEIPAPVHVHFFG
jgi:6-phosphogluconolactonase (cycloisomerase 2 family)